MRTLEERKAKARERAHKAYANLTPEEKKRRQEYRNEWRRKLRASNPLYREKERKASRERHATPSGKQWQRNMRAKRKLQNPTYHREYLLKTKYNLTPEQWEKIFLNQGRICAICKSPEPTTKHGWHVDHCHSTKKIRGILCHSCNTAIGLLKDNPVILRSAITYLTINSTQEK